MPSPRIPALNNLILLQILFSAMLATSAFMLVYYGRETFLRIIRRQERAYDRVLRRQLLLDIEPRVAVIISGSGIVLFFLFGLFVTGSLIVGLICGGLALFVPNLIIRYLEDKRREQLESQLVDGLTTLASGVRAGLNLIQSMELLVNNATGPLRQEFSQILREYQMGVDLNQALRNASNRIGSPLYRLTFTAIEMHRIRGGDSGESMDRIAESVREIRRLEGKLDALTAQGRAQAWMMAVMPIVFIIMLYFIEPEGVTMLITTTVGRLTLLGVVGLIVVAYLWIRKILAVDI